MLEIQERRGTHITILDLAGQLQSAGGDVALRETIRGMKRPDCGTIVLNLEQVSGVDAAGLGTLVFAKVVLESRGGRLILLNPSRHLRLLLSITQLDEAFDVIDNVPELDLDARIGKSADPAMADRYLDEGGVPQALAG